MRGLVQQSFHRHEPLAQAERYAATQIRLAPVYATIANVCTELKLEYSLGDDIFDESELIQDVFSLSFHSAVVICDFSGSNSSVYYEAGISPQCGHTLDWPLYSARGPRYRRSE